MMQRWREKLKYIEAGMISVLILFVATLIFGDNLTLEVIAFIVGTVLFSRVIERMDKKEIEKMKRQEEEELKDIV
jgi:Flp pilus assembly protein TadB